MNNTVDALMDAGAMANATNALMDTVAEVLSGSFNMTDDNMTTSPVSTLAPDPTPNPRPQRYLLTNTYVFNKIYTYAAFSTGIPGNFLTIIILARMRPINSVQVWLIGLSFVDFFTLTLRCFIVPFQSFGYFSYSDPQCIIQFMSSSTSEFCNYFFFLSMTVERFIAVWFPLKMVSWTSPKKAAMGMIGLGGAIFAFQLHHVWTYKAYRTGCFPRMEHYPFWNDIWNEKVETALFRALPLFSVLFLNIMIAAKLTLSKGLKDAMSEGQAKEKQRQQRQVNRLLTAATVFTFLSLMPDILYRLTYKDWGDYVNNWVDLRNVVIVMNVSASLKMGNHAGNFFCYIIVARKFRNELIHLLTCGRYGEHNGVKGSRLKAMK